MGKFKELSIDEAPSETTLPRELKAVITVMAADPELVSKALPHVDIDRQEINWEKIFENDFGGGHSAALLFAKAMWCDKVETQSDPFDRAFAMDPKLQSAVLRGLAIRWGLVA
jgi:hypothetical protein